MALFSFRADHIWDTEPCGPPTETGNRTKDLFWWMKHPLETYNIMVLSRDPDVPGTAHYRLIFVTTGLKWSRILYSRNGNN